MANIKDIAEHAGVSIATVSRTLREPHKVKPETAKKVMEAVDSLSYRTNMLASGLRTQRSDSVIVAVPDISNPFTSGFVQGIENIARENGIKVMLGITEGKQELLDRHYAMVAGKQADGMIILDTNIPGPVKHLDVQTSPTPVILACEYNSNAQLPRVRFDNIEAAALAADHIAKLGHTKVACVGGVASLQMSRDRQKGFRLGLRRQGIIINETLFVEGGYTLESGAKATKYLLSLDIPFTAILCENDEMAIGVIHTLAKAGIRVPEDVSVTGMDNLRYAEYANPGLTSVALPSSLVGEQAMRLMLDYYIDPASSVREVVLGHELVIRNSTAHIN
ncbi:LacI family transcriptional regulator [Aestuariibacter sp. GS-14]|uniref:LacI family DNA-binding transcriptional regulator n=1 Tax=Aestuariibacter sp. GS-14 TaxID=2590670 RepID=UPI00112E7193|nr:LacI family DNA-binding transcriptional regulator [Aestuariibacter sp. GS-14]TPV61796.1 LacI family transcriptional regulator [Aestuariibacter sp. GS-14]